VVRSVALVTLWLTSPMPLAAQNAGDWWVGLGDMPPGFHTIEVDSAYTIGGATPDEILGEMKRNGPGSDDVGLRLGLHVSQWRYSYQYTGGGQSGRCRLTEAQVLLRSVIVLPAWTDAATAPADVAAGWRPFLRSLTDHERGHRTRAKTQGANLWTSLLGLEAVDCPALERRVRETAESVLADGQEAQRRYDRETAHGATQGATWPH